MKVEVLIISSITVIALLTLTIFLYTWYRLHQSTHARFPPDENNIKRYNNLHYEPYTITTSDGVKLSSWYVPVKSPKAVVILLHGYGFPGKNGGKAHMLGHAQYLMEAGYATLLVDFRGYGKEATQPVTLGVNEWKDSEAAYDYAKTLPGTEHKKIGYLGISMGATTALITAGKTGKGDFVIASVPQANFDRLFTYQIKKEGFPLFLLPFLKTAATIELGKDYQLYSPDKWVSDIKVPTLYISADHDTDVDKEDAIILYNLANEPKSLWKANTGHDVFGEKPKEFEVKVITFLQRYIK